MNHGRPMFLDMFPGSWPCFRHPLYGDWNLSQREGGIYNHWRLDGERRMYFAMRGQIMAIIRSYCYGCGKKKKKSIVEKSIRRAGAGILLQMACCQLTIQKRPPERISPLMGRTAASRRQLPSWQRTASEEKQKRGPPTDL